MCVCFCLCHQMAPVKTKATAEKTTARSAPTNGMKRLSSNEKLASFEKEWKVIASELVTGERFNC